MNCNEIDRMLSNDWEGDEEIFVSEDECSKPFNAPIKLGCDEIVDKGPIPPKSATWDEFIEFVKDRKNEYYNKTRKN